MAAPNAEKVPAFDGKGTSILDFEQQAPLRMRLTETDPASRSPLLVLHMNSAPRRVCPSAGGGHSNSRDGVARFSGVISNYFAPEAADAIHQQLMRFTQYRRAGHSMGEFVVELDLLRHEAASRMDVGAGLLEQFSSILRMHNAAL